MATADRLRELLLSSPYIDIKNWQKGLTFAGPGYLDPLDRELLLGVKAQLDQVFVTGTEKVLKSYYDDDLLKGADLDTRTEER